MPEIDLTTLRKDYTLASLDESDVASDPLTQFGLWFEQALASGLYEPYAMSLATADAEGRPDARIVLLRAYGAAGFSFYTNYNSRKGRELAVNPRACLLFYWAELERQVRIEGTVAKLSEAQSDAYFGARPLPNRLGAWASNQSEPVASRAELECRFREAEARYGESVPRPGHWGGYCLSPTAYEFWQGRESRLHDRIAYGRNPDGDTWQIVRLSP